MQYQRLLFLQSAVTLPSPLLPSLPPHTPPPLPGSPCRLPFSVVFLGWCLFFFVPALVALCSNFVPSAILYPTLQPNLTYVPRSTTLGVQSTRIIFQLSKTVFNDQIQCYSSISRSRLNINCTSTIKGQGISYLPTGNVFGIGFLIFYLGVKCVGDVMTSLVAGLGQGSSLMNVLYQRLGLGLFVVLLG